MTRLHIRLVMLGVSALALGLGLAATATPTQAEDQTVPVGDIWFGDASFENGVYETAVQAGDTVTWDFSGASLPHTTTSDDGLWDSGILEGGTFQYTFDSTGVFTYTCSVHPTQMSGRVVVEDAGEEPTQPPPDSTPSADATQADGEGLPNATVAVSAPPSAGQGPAAADAASAWWLTGLLASIGLLLLGSAAFAYRRNR